MAKRVKNKELKQINSPRDNRKKWFRGFKRFIKLLGIYKKPEYVYLGKGFERGSLIISNHVGSSGPLTLELYMEKPIRFWGTYEMNSGLRSVYKYLTTIYYPQKKGWSVPLAKIFGIIAAPVANLFYKGLNLISTYKDARFVKTVHQSLDAIRRGESIVVFPEDSSKGYFEELTCFFAGFAMFADVCYKKGMDLPIYVTYLNKEEGKFLVDAPIYYSEFVNQGKSRTEIADILLDRCNALGKMSKDESYKNVHTEENQKQALA